MNTNSSHYKAKLQRRSGAHLDFTHSRVTPLAPHYFPPSFLLAAERAMYYLLGPVACFALIASVLWAPSGRCRCRPWEPCWPSAADWHALNDSLQGSLVRIRPVASVCHGSEYDVAACANLSSLVADSGWRASNPSKLPFLRSKMDNELL